jgi:hypothetical protein
MVVKQSLCNKVFSKIDFLKSEIDFFQIRLDHSIPMLVKILKRMFVQIKKTKYEHKTLNSSYRARHIKSILPQIQNYKRPGMCVHDGTTDHIIWECEKLRTERET